MKEMFDLLLYPYVEFGLSASVSPRVYEYNTIPTLTYTAYITNGSKEINTISWDGGKSITRSYTPTFTTKQTSSI